MDIIRTSNKILILSHFGPDPDAYASMLFTYGVLKENFPEKNIEMFNAGPLSNEYSYLRFYNEIKTGECFDFLTSFEPDLLIILDSPSIERISYNKVQEIREYIKVKNIKSIWLDHHLIEEKDEKTLLVNEKRSSAVETAYIYLVKDNNLSLYTDVENTVLLGITSDTSRFLYKNDFHRDTFSIVSDMLDRGGSIEFVEEKSNQYSKLYIDIYDEFLSNLQSNNGYNFSFLSDKLFDNSYTNIEKSQIKTAYHKAMDTFIRNFNNIDWGFIVLPDIENGKGFYKTSFRASSLSHIDTSKFTVELGGGGHIQASAASKIPAKNIQEALIKIHEVIEKVRNNALI